MKNGNREPFRRSIVEWREAREGHKGWHSRGYLPHFDDPALIQTVTFRLADSLPRSKQHLFEIEDDGQKRREIEKCLNRGYGSCSLRRPEIAREVEDALLHFEGERYRMLAWVVMHNHVHAIFEPLYGFSLGEIIDSWKGHTVSVANRILGRKGHFWAKDYFDRYVRDVDHFHIAIRYVHENPVKAGIAQTAATFRWSSAWEGRMKEPELKPDYRGRIVG